MSGQTYILSQKIEITPEDVDYLIDAAFYGGITYWCDTIRYDKEPDTEVKAMSEALTKGGIIGIHDSEEYVPETGEYGRWHELTLEKVLQAIADEQVDFDDYDSLVADNVIQRAIFGEVIYG